MVDPTANDIGRKVVYRDRSGYVVEEGVITSFNPTVVFVRYGSDAHSKGTSRADLEKFTRYEEDADTPPLPYDGCIELKIPIADLRRARIALPIPAAKPEGE